MAWFRQRYGAHPLHLLVLLASFALTGYAALQLLQAKVLAVLVWFVGAAVLHDLALVPIYWLADAGPLRLWRRRPGRLPTGPWLNYLRVPALLSALLLLVYAPDVFRLSDIYRPTTDLSSAGYLARWLAVTGALFALSALAFAVQLRVRRSPEPAAGTNDGAAGDGGA